jgi:cholest-4-en-3-one 26-monooxygenase
MLSSHHSAPSRSSAVDLCTPLAFRDGFPHAIFKRLRAEAPVYWNESSDGHSFWVVSRYKDIWDISLDQATYSSAKKTCFLKVWDDEEMIGVKEQMVNMDPPLHTKYRRLVNLGFSPKIVNRLETAIRKMANEIIDRIAARGECDFVVDVAAELPLQVIVELVGVPQEDRHRVFDWSNRMIGYDDPEYMTSPEDGHLAAMELFQYAQQLAESRRADPKDDLATVLTQASVEGEKLTESQFNNFFLLLMVAGNETTRNTISGGMLALSEHPAQRRRLLADRALMPTAVDEIVRWVAPVMNFVRTATRDLELHGQKIREGDRLTIWYPSANRDEDVFPDGDVFDVGRTPNDHLGFGIGPHFCLGANLARLEIRIMFEELLRRLPDIEVAGPVDRLKSNFIGGFKHMPVRFTPER